MITILISLVILSGFFDGFMDHFQFRLTYKHPWNLDPFFDPEASWMNKYKGLKKENGPAFFGSTTFLVFLTDGWHFFKALKWACLQAAIILAITIEVIPEWPWIDLPIWADYLIAYFLLWLVRASSFHFTFHHILTANNIRIMQKLFSKLWSLFRALYPSAPGLIAIAIGAVLFILLAGLSSLAPWMDYVVAALLVVAWLAGMKLLIQRFRHPRKPSEEG